MAARAAPLILKAPLEFDPLEGKHQEKIFETLEFHKIACPSVLKLYAIPNGGKRDIRTAIAMQRQGTRPGIPDMALDVPMLDPDGGTIYHGLKLELKRFRDGVISDEQKARLAQNAADGYRAIVCWGWRAAVEEVLWYLGREDLLTRPFHFTTRIIKAYPEHPFWQRKQ